MSSTLNSADIKSFLECLGERITTDETIYLIGGSALILLGSPRVTLDIDYVGSEFPSTSDSFAAQIKSLADEMHFEVEPVQLDEFIPLPDGADQRHHLIGEFGNLTVYVFDPYSVAISKLDRGFESDLEDVIFLIERKMITLEMLRHYVSIALKQWFEFDLNPQACIEHLEIVERSI